MRFPTPQRRPMRQGRGLGPTFVSPQQKLIAAGNSFGNFNLKKQQGSTIIIYDTLPLDTATNLTFFEGAQSRAFPFTNLNEGKLAVGESMVIKRITFALLTIVDPANPAVSAVATPESLPATASGEFELVQANKRILKKLPLLSTYSFFNKSSQFLTQSVFRFETDLTIQPQLEFSLPIRFSSAITAANVFLRCTIEGSGSLNAPKPNF